MGSINCCFTCDRKNINYKRNLFKERIEEFYLDKRRKCLYGESVEIPLEKYNQDFL